MRVALPYGKTKLEADLPEDRILKVMHSRLDGCRPAASGEELVRQSLERPIGSMPLAELAEGKKKVVLLASDHTRPVPSRIIVPQMLSEIRRRNPDAEVMILIATGCHRGTRREELEQKFGPEIMAREHIVIHDCRDDANLVKIGTLPSGGDLIINRMAAEADLLVAEGFIEPHFFAGYSGGRKSVLPGVAAREAVYYNHNAAFIDDPGSRAGILEGNPIHRDMIYAARKANLAFIVNVVINSEKQIVASFAGDCEAAHLEGTRFLHGLAAERPVPADIVITTNNGYPLDQNAYQAVKSMCTAEATCREGGVIIVAAQCCDGVGGDSFYRTFRENPSAEAILEDFRRRAPCETVEDQWQSQIFARILSKHTVILISDLPDTVVRELHMIPAGTVEEALAEADRLLRQERAQICVIPEGISTMICPE